MVRRRDRAHCPPRRGRRPGAGRSPLSRRIVGSGAIAGIAGLVDGQAPLRQGIRSHHPHGGVHDRRPRGPRRVGRHEQALQRAFDPQELPQRAVGIQCEAGKLDSAHAGRARHRRQRAAAHRVEKRATVRNCSRPLRHLPSRALRDAEHEAARPARGSHAPGTFWYYNNWDFNALGTIFEQARRRRHLRGLQAAHRRRRSAWKTSASRTAVYFDAARTPSIAPILSA